MGEQELYQPPTSEANAAALSPIVEASATPAKEGGAMSPQLEAVVKALEKQGVTLEDFGTTASKLDAELPPQKLEFTNENGQLFTLTKDDRKPGGTPDGEVHYNVNY